MLCDDSCTVVCFKAHKTSGCSSEKEYIPISTPLPLFQPLDTATPLSSPLLDSAPDSQDVKPTESRSNKRSRDEIIRANRPTKKLVDLKWPVEPLESMWDDPLSRDDLKPLRGWEYEAIGSSDHSHQSSEDVELMKILCRVATDPALRRLLAVPKLQEIIGKLLRSSNNPTTRDSSLRLLLGLDPSLPQQHYRPSTSASSFTRSEAPSSILNSSNTASSTNSRGRGGGRGGRGGRDGGSGRGAGREDELFASTVEERRLIAEFAGEVGRVFGAVRVERGM